MYVPFVFSKMSIYDVDKRIFVVQTKLIIEQSIKYESSELFCKYQCNIHSYFRFSTYCSMCHMDIKRKSLSVAEFKFRNFRIESCL